MLNTGRLSSGGVMVNYRCSAACRHCLYSCSPTRKAANSPDDYVDEESAEEICRLLKKGDCPSVHIGGGEPFLDFEGLLMMVRKLGQARVRLDYIETNASWLKLAGDSSLEEANRKEAGEKLRRLMDAGANCLLISHDSFHAEYVPKNAPLFLAELCGKAGMDFFLWDAQQSGISYGGRAVNIERELAPLRQAPLHKAQLYPAENFTAKSSPCRNLLHTGHFHVDLNCNFIPPRCTGIIIPLSEALTDIPEGKYAAFQALYSGGVSALMSLARQQGFSADPAGYPSRCNLCFHLRHFLAEKGFREFDLNHYEEALKY
ncbi:MAG: 4Fe-4S cluster-binding domain-containing protein [Treponema sp.]|nr:4Fe-4S cluster-binding domain-containing protein [Treponema sp.]